MGRSVFLVLGACLALGALGCTGGNEEADPASGEGEPAWWSMEQLDADWEAYQRQHQLFVDGPFPLDTPPVDRECSQDSACDQTPGFNVGGAFYATGVETAAELEVEGPVASLPIGEVFTVAGMEPAAYLVAGEPGRWVVLQSYDLPLETTARARALELRRASCSVPPALESALAPPFYCGQPTVSWLVAERAGPWTVDDPFQLSDERVHRTEPTDETRHVVRSTAAAGTPLAPLRTSLGPSGWAGPYTSADEALASLHSQYCADVGTGCRSGYRVESTAPATPTRVDFTIMTQRATPGPESRLETFYARGSIEQLDGAGWWFTETGPSAVHQNGSGPAALADAEQRFDDCCDATTGRL